MRENDLSKDRMLIALGGLLHDVGKFLFRAREHGFEFEEIDLNDSLKRRDKKEYEAQYKYEHAYLSSLVFEWFIRNEIISEDEKQKLINWGARHHNPTNELESIVCQIADWYSSSEREIVLGSCIGLMHSVFERISMKPKKEREEAFKDIKEWHSRDLDCEKLIDDSNLVEWDKRFGFYVPAKLEISRIIFPELFEGKLFVGKIVRDEKSKCLEFQNEDVLIVPTNRSKFEETKKAEKNYANLFNNFLFDLKKASNLKGLQLFNYIYYLFYKYTWCVPASIFDRKKLSNHYPDISLFDHSRVLSAIALSIYDWAIEGGKGPENIKPIKTEDCWYLSTDDQEVFLLVEGDIGGIQKFIFNIHKSSESELSIAKALRGRSFFLTMLPEVLARYILSKLEYPITNALFIGGGKFQLLVGNTKKNLERIEKIEREINEWLFEAFHGELSISIATVKMKGDVFRNVKKEGKETFLDKVEEVQLELDKKKKKRFGELIWKDEFVEDPTDAKSICKSCRSLPVANIKEELCYWCDKSQEWGKVLPKVRYIAFDFEGENLKKLEKEKVMCFGKFGKVYLLEENDLSKVKDLPEILNIEDTEFKIEADKVVNGFKFIGHSAPRVLSDNSDYFVSFLNKKLRDKRGRDLKNWEKLDKEHILPFDLLVEFAEGDKKLGFLRADVDYLGLILSDGLRYNEFGNEEIYTISRIATLSRMLDLFFAGYLNKLAEEVSLCYVKRAIESYKQRSERLSASEIERKELLEEIYDEKEDKLKIGSLIYTVYSGGDDLFVIAPYDLAIEFALKLREEFREFTCENPEFGISGGIYIGRHDTPIHLVARFTEDLENKAKKSRIAKDMITTFDKALLWSKEIEDYVDRKGVMFCSQNSENDVCKGQKMEPCYIFLKTVYEEIANKMINWLRSENTGVSRGLYYKLLQLHKDYVDGDKIDPKIYPKIYYYVGRNVKNENVRNELIDTLLNGMGGKLDVRAVITNLDVILSLVLMKTRGGR